MIIAIAVFSLCIVFAIVVTWKPPAVLAAMMSFYAFEQWTQANSSFFAAHPRLLNYALAGIVLYAVVISTLRYGSPLRRIPVVAWLTLALVGLSVASYLWSINLAASKDIGAFFLPYLIVNVVLVPLVIRSIDDLRVGIATFILVGTPIAIMLLGTDVLGLSGRSLAFVQTIEDRYGRPIESGNALAIGSFGGYLVICAAFLSWQGMAHRWFGMVRWLIVALGFALVARSQSRGQMAAAVAVTGAMIALPAFLGWRPKNLALAAAGAIILFLVLPWAVTFSLAEDRFDLRQWGQEFADTRVQYCSDLLQYWLDQGNAVHWLFGIGSGSAWHVIEVYPHVIPVELLVELGMLGLLIYLVLMAWLLLTSGKLLFQLRKNPDVQSLLLVLIGLWLFETLLTFKQGTFLSSVQWMTFGILLANFNIFVKDVRRSSVMQRRRHLLSQLAGQPIATPSYPVP